MKKIELLYFDGCPSWKTALSNLRSALSNLGYTGKIDLVKIENDLQAQEIEFLGSPSIRVDGIDLWPAKQDEYHLGCRVYATPHGLKGSPTIEMLQSPLAELLKLGASE